LAVLETLAKAMPLGYRVRKRCQDFNLTLQSIRPAGSRRFFCGLRRQVPTFPIRRFQFLWHVSRLSAWIFRS
jgi:hypothetical protein